MCLKRRQGRLSTKARHYYAGNGCDRVGTYDCRVEPRWRRTRVTGYRSVNGFDAVMCSPLSRHMELADSSATIDGRENQISRSNE